MFLWLQNWSTWWKSQAPPSLPGRVPRHLLSRLDWWWSRGSVGSFWSTRRKQGIINSVDSTPLPFYVSHSYHSFPIYSYLLIWFQLTTTFIDASQQLPYTSTITYKGGDFIHVSFGYGLALMVGICVSGGVSGGRFFFKQDLNLVCLDKQDLK